MEKKQLCLKSKWVLTNSGIILDIEMPEQQIQQLVERLKKLERIYLENGFPLTALKIFGSRVDDARLSTNEKGIAELVRKADKALRQAESVAKSYLDERITEGWRTTNDMRMELHQDHPRHYLIQD